MRALALLTVLGACTSPPPPSATYTYPDLGVEMYLTTGDRATLLARQPAIAWSADTSFAPRIDVDDRARFQEMVGFGAALTDASAWLMAHALSPAGRDSLLRDLFGPEPGLGFSFVRVDMGASDFATRHYSYDDVSAGARDDSLTRFSIAADTAETIPILRRALALNPQLAIMASPWSAPAWMKSSGSLIKGTLRADAYDPFARYFVKFIRAYASHGVPIFAISVQNEPHFEPENYPGMRLDPSQRARFVGQFLGPLFAREHIATRILDWDHNWDQPESPLAVLADSVARRFVSGVAWHCYGGDVSAQGRVHEAHPDKDAYFTECSGGAWAPTFGDNLLWTTRYLVIGAPRNWARGVLMWNLALDERAGPHLGGCGDCRGVVTIDSRTGAVTRNEEYFALGHASRFVRSGAYRIESTTRQDSLETVAFRNPDGSTVLIVANPLHTDQAFAVQLHGRGFRAQLPGTSVATFRWR